MNCKYCNSENVIKFGTYEGEQRFYCKDCERKFSDTDTIPKMQYPIDHVAAAVAMYYEGLSLNEIKRMMSQIYNTDVSDQGIYNWVERFSKDAVQISGGYHPDVGYVWLADETVIDIGGKQWWLIDVIDLKTRFLLASTLSEHRYMDDIQTALIKAYKRAGKRPKVIMTDHQIGYVRGIPNVFGNYTRHLQVEKLTAKPNNNIIERFHSTIKSRTKIMRDLKSPESARMILDGFFVHYNFMRPHETLSKSGEDVTPALKAEIRFPCNNWEKLVRNSEQAKRQISVARFDVPILPYRAMTKLEQQQEYERLRKQKRRQEIKLGIPPSRKRGPNKPKNITPTIHMLRMDK